MAELGDGWRSEDGEQQMGNALATHPTWRRRENKEGASKKS